MNPSTPIEQITRIGPIYQKRLKKLGIQTVRDLLFHFPHRYEDFSNIIPISEIKLNENCCVQGEILEIENSRSWKKRIFITNAILQDKTGAIKVTWFNQPYLTKTLKPKDQVCLAGRPTFGKNGIYLASPAYEKISSMPKDNPGIDQNNGGFFTHTGRIIPVYPETEKLSSRWLRYVVKSLLTNLGNTIADPLPEKIIEENNFLPVQRALWQIHFPDSFELAQKARERFSFEELFFIELAVLRSRLRLNREKATAIPFNLDLIKRFVGSLPFKLTDSQRKSAWQILKDIEKTRPMNRLLEGDVGSGKTVVAAIAVLNTVKAGGQAAFMAPTEILANQHFKTVWELIKNFNLNVGLLTGKKDRFFSRKLKNQFIEISRKKLLEKTLNGEINVLIGTHALISSSAPRGYGKARLAFAKATAEQSKIKFKNLALIIIDEQHRFGVEQRAKLCRQKELIPHLLSMTATPIPRTLALTIYGDLDLSLINELPRGRKKIITKVVAPEDRLKAYSFIKKEVKKGRQVFVICPRIEPAANNQQSAASYKKDVFGWTEAKAVKEEYEKLSKKIFPNLKVGLLHGKLAAAEKERTMINFKNGKIDILVSTSVVEVGVDVPNATVMMIEGSEKFGLAQLHQFRGRVGRSRYQSYCFLLTDSPAKKTRQRLRALVGCDNGFELAEKDLEIRGPGDFSGARQWGIPDLVMSSLKDISLIEKSRFAAKNILEQDPALKNYPQLTERIKIFQERIHLE